MTHAQKLLHDHFIRLAKSYENASCQLRYAGHSQWEEALTESNKYRDRAEALAKIGTKGDDNETD